MIYDYRTCDRATVFDVDTKEKISRVLAVNAGAGWIKVSTLPLRANEHGQVVAHRIRFRAIHPIYGGGTKPCLFHCYGRQP